MSLNNFDDAEKKALSYCLKIIQNKDYTEFEIKNKLLKKQVPEFICNKIIDFLIEKKFINDRLYAENRAYFLSKSKNKGIDFIKKDLKKKGIDTFIIQDALGILNKDDEKIKVINIIKKKFYNYDFKDKKNYNKIFNYLKYRGFESEIILEAINNFRKQEGV